MDGILPLSKELSSRETLIHNERIKLRANFWDSTGVGAFITIGVMPAFVPDKAWLFSALCIAGGLLMAMYCHLVGVHALSDMK